MVWPVTPLDVEVGLFLNGAWTNAVTTGNGVRHNDRIDITHGRKDWSRATDVGTARFTLDNRDGRWSPDNPASPYFGQYRRNIPCRVGIGRGETHMRPTGTSKDLASTPDLVGGGGGGSSGAAPAFVSNTATTVTTDSTTHAVAGPATVATGDRLLLVIAAGHDSLTPKDLGGGATDLDGWTLVAQGNLYTPFHAWRAYEIEAATSALATALSGQTFDFTTTTACRSAAQVIRTSGARSGGSGTAWAVQAVTTTAFDANPNPPSLSAPWGAYNHRWYSFAVFGTGGDTVSTYPASYTSIADTGSSSTTNIHVASAHRTTGVATEDPGTFALTGTENWQALTFVYRAQEVAGSDGALDIPGDIDIRAEFELEEDLVDITKGGQRVRLAHKVSGADGWELELYYFAGRVTGNFTWRDSGGVTHNVTTAQTGTNPPLDFQHEHRALRVTLDVDNGAAGHTVTWYTSTTIGGTWTQLGSPVVTAGTTSIKTNDAPLRVGGNPFDGTVIPLPGKIYAFQLRNGINGTIVANPAFNAQAVGATGFTDSAGRVWTIASGGRISNMLWRFHGELASLPVRWNTNGSDITAPVEAAGLFRRLRQGNRTLESAIRRAIVRGGLASLVQYWPMEEENDGTMAQFGPAVGTAAISITGGPPKPATSDVFLASSKLPTLETASLSVDVDPYTDTGQWQVRWLQFIPSTFTGDALYYVRVETTDMVWEVEFRDDAGGQLQVHAYRGLTEVYSSGYISFDATGKGMRMTLNVVQNGSSVDYTLEGQAQGSDSAGGVTVVSAVAGSAGRVTRIKINKDANVGSWTFGHVTLQSAKTLSTELATELNAYTGERAATRIQRLCLEEGIAFRIEGDPATTEQMGPQRAGTLIALLQECADTDLGILHESRETVAVGYRTRVTMLDQPFLIDLNYAAGEVASSPELDRDDQDFANDVTIRNRVGTTARAVLDDGTPMSISEPPVGAGRYDRTYQVNAPDGRLSVLAQTRLALTTVDEPRVSRLALAMHHAAMVSNVALTSAVFDASLGDRVRVQNNLAAALGAGGTIDQLAQGTRESITSFTHTIDLLTTPASPWTGGGVAPPAEGHTVKFRHQRSLPTSGAPPHILSVLGNTGTTDIARADLDAILNAWVAGTGGTTRTATSVATWNTAMAAALPGDLIRVTSSFTGDITARGSRYSLAGSNMTASPAGGTAAKPIIITCANGVTVTGSSTSSGVGVLDVLNTTHVWPVGFNTAGGQFGIRCWNWGGTAGFPAYRAYCNVTGTGHSAYSAQGWFQLIATSGGTPPSGTGNEWGFSQYFVDEENYAADLGKIADAFGEAYYYGRGSAPGWVSYCKDFWSRGNEGYQFRADGIDLKPGCHRFWVTDNRYHGGYCVSGSPMTINYCSSDLDARPSWMPADVEGYLEGNRVWDINITLTNGSSANIGAYSGLSGLRWANNMFWGIKQTGFTGGICIRNEKGTDDTTAVATFGTAPTWFVNNFYWGTTGAVVKGGYGVGGGFPLPYPGSVVFTERNNVADNLTNAQFQADTTDFIATVPAVAAAGDAVWLTYGPGSAFDLSDTSPLRGAGVSIADLNTFIDADISQRAFPIPMSPGPFQVFT